MRQSPEAHWNAALEQIASAFGQLVYLHSLRSFDDGHYRHDGIAQLWSEDTADRVLRGSHREVFERWIRFSMEEKLADLELYFASTEKDRVETLQYWLGHRPYQTLLPDHATLAQKQHYLADMQMLVALLTRAGAGPNPAA